MAPPSLTTMETKFSNEMDDDVDELDLLLAEASEDINAINQQTNFNSSSKLITVEAKTQILSTQTTTPILRDDSSFAQAFSSTASETTNNIIEFATNISNAAGQTTATTEIEKEFDSSDDEDVKNYLERKYNEYGRDIKNKLKSDSIEKTELKIRKEVDNNINKSNDSLFNKNKPRISSVADNKNNNVTEKPDPSRSFKPIKTQQKQSTLLSFSKQRNIENAVFTDPIFGLRIINPLISSTVLIERMNERKPISVSGLQFHLERGDLEKDWVVAGTILSKSPVKTTKNGGSYSIWRLSDLKSDIKTFSMFLFKNAHKELWKTAIGMCIAVLNPGVFERRQERSDVACLTIDIPQKVMILGQSKDLGTCKAKKKNGENCTAIVNLNECDFCVYHIKNEFNKMSQRTELQSSTAGRGLQELRNKVLGKSEIFYAGQSYSAVPAKKSGKLTAKDNLRMQSLSEYFNSPNAGSINHKSTPKSNKLIDNIPYAVRDGIHSKIASNVECNTKQRMKDVERLNILKDEQEKFEKRESLSSNSSILNANDEKQTTSVNKLNSPNVPEKFKNREFSFASPTIKPTLSKESFSIEFSISNNKKGANAAKQKALEILKKKPIEKSNPNFIKYRGTETGKKRVMEELNDFYNNTAKRQKMEDDRKEYERKSRLQKIIDASSSNLGLIEIRENEEQEKYFSKLEKKEAMEEKMLNTYQVACKAVICLQCKYTAFSAADRCKDEKHQLKVIDAEKRFFKCMDCGNRTVTVHKLPKISCKNCHSSKWQRAAMIREKKLNTNNELSIRGDEEKFMGSLCSSATLNLLVPDEE